MKFYSSPFLDAPETEGVRTAVQLALSNQRGTFEGRSMQIEQTEVPSMVFFDDINIFYYKRFGAQHLKRFPLSLELQRQEHAFSLTP